jgi:hypothetical protein
VLSAGVDPPALHHSWKLNIWMRYNGDMERYHFPPMLGPASRKPEGSYEWAECCGNELDYHVERLAREVDHFAKIIGKLAATDPPPWSIFPNPPCRTADAFFRLCGGMTREKIAAVLVAFGHADLADVVRKL